jgi:hypothetical protein
LHAAVAARGADPAKLDPWYFPSAEDYRARLESAGFEVRSITLFDRPTLLSGDIAGWLETFAQPFLSGVAEGERRAVIAEVRERTMAALCDGAGRWTADYVRLRFLAVKR